MMERVKELYNFVSCDYYKLRLVEQVEKIYNKTGKYKVLKPRNNKEATILVHELNSFFKDDVFNFVNKDFAYGINSVLELGCGNGRNLIALSKQRDFSHVKLCGIELSHAGFNLCKGKGFTVLHGNCLDVLRNMRDDGFDIVFSVHALEQMNPMLLDVIRECYRVCKKGVVFFEPEYSFQSFWGKLHNVNSDYCRGIPFLMEQVGFKDIQYFRSSLPVQDSLNKTFVIGGKKI